MINRLLLLAGAVMLANCMAGILHTTFTKLLTDELGKLFSFFS